MFIRILNFQMQNANRGNREHAITSTLTGLEKLASPRLYELSEPALAWQDKGWILCNHQTIL